MVTLQKEQDGDLYKAVIHGRPIVLDLNRSCFLSNSEAIATYGTAALNVTGSYFSEDKVPDKLSDTLPHYEDWVIRELAERIQNKNEFTIKTHRALFHARVGARVKLEVNKEQREKEELLGTINSFSFRYTQDEAFVATFKIREE